MTAKEFLRKKGCASFGWPQIGTTNGEILVNVDDLLEEYHQEKLKGQWVSTSDQEVPTDGTYILRWHRKWKCPVAVSFRPDAEFPNLFWIEKTKTVRWPETSFSPAWMPLPPKP